MASMTQDKKAEDDDNATEKTTCPVCLEPHNELKIVGKCQHSCCTRCLWRHMEKMKQTSVKFTCPTCHGECGLGYDGEGAAAQGTDSSNTGKKRDFSVVKADQTPKQDKFQIDVKCQICQHRGQNVQAHNLCVKCDPLYLCKDCTDVHVRNKATKDHVVVPLKTTQSERDKPEICTRHLTPLTSYCRGCNEPACKICIHIDHGDHDIEKLSDFIKAKVKEVKVVIKKREIDFKRMSEYKKELFPLKNAALFLEDDDDDLMKDIEDHAQACIDEVIKLKEACIDEVIKLKEELKAGVRTRIEQRKQVKQDVSAVFDAVTERIEKIQQPLAKATKLVSERQHGLGHLKQLTSIKQHLEVNASQCDQINREKFHDRIYKFLGEKYTFVKGELPILGKLEEETIPFPNDKFRPKSIHEHTITADSEEKFVPCVANFGKQYAVAHPTTKRTPSNAIDVYELSGTLKFTLQENVGPVHDMSSTPDNKLAVLTDGNDGVSQCSVKVYDTDTGKLCSNTNPQIKGSTPISLGVNFQNQYVILSDKTCRKGIRKVITICNGDGSIEHDYIIIEGTKFKNLSRVTCGFKYIYVMGERAVGVYEVKDTGLVQKSIITQSIFGASDISASVLDHLFLADVYRTISTSGLNIELQRYHDENNKSDWNITRTQVNYASQTEKQCRIAVKGRHIIMSSGRTINVYKY